MEKQKLEKIILIASVSIFLLLWSSKALKNAANRPAKTKANIDVGITAQETNFAEVTIEEPKGVLDVKYEGSGKDPLKNLIAVYINNNKIAPPKPELPIVPMPTLNIQGLLWKSDTPQAIVNGKILRIGDNIEGVKVLAIERDGIRVEHGGMPVFVKSKK